MRIAINNNNANIGITYQIYSRTLANKELQYFRVFDSGDNGGF